MGIAISPEQLDVRRELMIQKLADWTEEVDPCADGHVEHGPEAHIGRHLVHSVSRHGFGAVWDYDDAVAFIRAAVDIGASIEGPRSRNGHIGCVGPDGTVMGFEVQP